MYAEKDTESCSPLGPSPYPSHSELTVQLCTSEAGELTLILFTSKKGKEYETLEKSCKICLHEGYEFNPLVPNLGNSPLIEYLLHFTSLLVY